MQSEGLRQGRDAQFGVEQAHEGPIGGQCAGAIAGPGHHSNQICVGRFRERVDLRSMPGVTECRLQIPARDGLRDQATESLREKIPQSIRRPDLPVHERRAVP
jgi:hypothetical protein